jgi:7-carboxy-7-deazaguanine synthase
MQEQLIHEVKVNSTIGGISALSPLEKRRVDVLRVNEIFHSIQGESSRAGEPCVFVRLTGCGLRCVYCDTEYAFFEGEDASIDEVMDRVRAYETKLAELTGGEPLEQEGVYTLMDRLLSEGFEVMIETGGHMDISRVPPSVKRIVDLKTPSSEMMHRNRYENIPLLTQHDEIKFVIGDRLDYEWSREKIESLNLPECVGTILLSPIHGSLELQLLAAWILEDKLPVKMQVQLHKLIWPEVVRGV